MPLPTSSRKRAGDADRECCRGLGCWDDDREAVGGVPGVNRSARHEQHTKAALQATQATDACAHTRKCATCQGSEGRGVGKTAKSVTIVLFNKVCGG